MRSAPRWTPLLPVLALAAAPASAQVIVSFTDVLEHVGAPLPSESDAPRPSIGAVGSAQAPSPGDVAAASLWNRLIARAAAAPHHRLRLLLDDPDLDVKVSRTLVVEKDASGRDTVRLEAFYHLSFFGGWEDHGFTFIAGRKDRVLLKAGEFTSRSGRSVMSEPLPTFADRDVHQPFVVKEYAGELGVWRSHAAEAVAD